MTTEQIYPQARHGAGGTLLFPHKGEPPKAINGYKRDPNDPYVFYPILENCQHRSLEWVKVCGGMVQKLHCRCFKIRVCVADCLSCKEVKQ